MIKIRRKLNVSTVAQGRKTIRRTDANTSVKPKRAGKIPRVARLMALAITMEKMLRSGEARDMVELARRGQVTQPRMTQIMALNLLAPDIQEALLKLPLETKGKPFLHEKRLRPLTTMLHWSDQGVAWKRLLDMQEQSADASE